MSLPRAAQRVAQFSAAVPPIALLPLRMLPPHSGGNLAKLLPPQWQQTLPEQQLVREPQLVPQVRSHTQCRAAAKSVIQE